MCVCVCVCFVDKQASGTRSASKQLLVDLHCLQDHQETEQGSHYKRRQNIIQEEDSLIWLRWQGLYRLLLEIRDQLVGFRLG